MCELEEEVSGDEGPSSKMMKTSEPSVESCIIHCSNDSTPLIAPRDLSSWETLRTAATIRKHLGLLQIDDETAEGHIPDIRYHRKCRSLFTMIKDLNKIEKTQEHCEEDVDKNTKTCEPGDSHKDGTRSS